MSKWRAIALAGLARRENAHEIRVPLVSLVPIGPAGGANGTIGTAPEIDLDERLAMALAGGVPAVYAEAFARMQVADPYSPTVDDAGRFLDFW